MGKFNKNEFKWLIILIGLTYYIFTLINTGKIYYFIHPRMVKYVRISFVFLIILIIVQLKRLFIISKRKKISFIVFLLPLTLGFMIKPQDLSGEVAANKGVAILQNSISKTSSVSSIKDKKNVEQVTTNNENMLVVTDKNFINTFNDMTYDNINKYQGKKIKITGFVYRDETIQKNQFKISRSIMVCCAADVEISGVLCDYNNASEFKNLQWITVTGTINIENHKDGDDSQLIPVIKVEKIEPAQKPSNPYLYPQ